MSRQDTDKQDRQTNRRQTGRHTDRETETLLSHYPKIRFKNGIVGNKCFAKRNNTTDGRTDRQPDRHHRS